MSFFIDTKGDSINYKKEELRGKVKDFLKDIFDENEDSKLPFVKKTSSEKDIDSYINELNCLNNKKSKNEISISTKSSKSFVDELMKKSILSQPDFEDLHSLPPLYKSKRRLKYEKKMEKEKSKGEKWFNLPAPEITDEVKRDLEMLQMRSVLDPKHFYKKNDMSVLPKYFQIGKVVDSPLDYYNNRLTKKQRKRTLVDELLNDVEFKKFNKRKYKEIIEERRKTQYKDFKKSKKNLKTKGKQNLKNKEKKK